MQNQRLGNNSNSTCSCVQGSQCAENQLVGRLINILESAKKADAPAKFPALKLQANSDANANSVQKALSNSLVLREILSGLKVDILLELRQVCKIWNQEITSQLLSPRHEESLHVKFRWPDSGHAFQNWLDSRALSDFMEKFMATCEIFPCTEFLFIGGQLSDPTLVQFFSEYGSRVHHLTLKTGIVQMPTLENVVFKWATNLKSLVLEPNNWANGQNLPQDDDGKEFQSLSKSSVSKNPKLPNLRKITLPKIGASDLCPGGQLIQRILTCAPNLAWIEDPELAYIPQIIAAGKLPLVKSLTFHFSNEEYFYQNVLRFVAAGPQLTSLNFEHVGLVLRPSLFPSLQSLIQSSRATLEKIFDIERLRDFHPRFQVPPLPRVTQWKVRVSNDPRPSIFSEGPALCQIFPKLKSLHVEVDNVGLSNHPFNSPSHAHNLVQKLKIKSCYAERAEGLRSEWIEVLGRLYPKVTHLDLYFTKMVAKTLPECFKVIPKAFPLLEQLFIHICSDHLTSDDFQRQMDEALTGLPQNIWEQLWRRLEPDPEFQKPEVLERIRIASSILDLKKLARLTFEIDVEYCEYPFWSRMAYFYAFQPMTKRQGFEVNVRGSRLTYSPLTRADLGPL